MKRKMKCSRCGGPPVIGRREDLPVCDRCAYALGVETGRAELEARIEDRDFWHRRASSAEAALAESDAAFRALKDSIGRADSERVELRRRAEVAERKVLDLEHNLAHEEERAHVAEGKLERVRATVEAEKHYTEGCGWDVPVIRVLAALHGEGKQP